MTFFRAVLGLCAGLALSACQTTAPSQSQAPPVVSAPVLAVVPAARPLVLPDRLIGLSAKEILGIFGPPSLKRRESPAELWQYAANACVMDLYLYAEGEEQRVSYVTLRDPASGRVGGAACQDQLGRLSGR